MPHCHFRAIPAIIVCVATLDRVPLSGQEVAFNDWLNARLDSLVALRLALRDGAKQPDVPAASASGASLVDRAAMPDILGIHVSLPNQPKSGGQGGASAMAFSSTLYALWARLKGKNSLDPGFYHRAALARRVGINATFDTDGATGATTTLLQAKVLILDRGNAIAGAAGLRRALAEATSTFGDLRSALEDTLFARVGGPRRQNRAAFINSLEQAGPFREVLAELRRDGLAAIDRMIERALADFVTLRNVVAAAVAESRRRPELAIGLTARAAGTLTERVRAMLIFDYLARPSVDLTLNAGAEHVRATAVTPARTRLEAAGQLLWRLTPDDRLDGRGPLSATLAISAAFDLGAGGERTLKVQARWLLPVTEGINVPVSVTWANRTDLIDEDRVQGQLGFSFDTGQIFGSLLR